jgi:hypothetical protein
MPCEKWGGGINAAQASDTGPRSWRGIPRRSWRAEKIFPRKEGLRASPALITPRRRFTLEFWQSVASPMRPTHHQVFQAGVAAKLNELELVAALLERDATNNRVLLVELSSAYSHTKTADENRRAQRWRRWRAFAPAVDATARHYVGGAKATARSPRLHAALRAGYAFVIDFAIVMATACAGVAVLALAILLAAPPA